jgi:dihydroneopterin aldolase
MVASTVRETLRVRALSPPAAPHGYRSTGRNASYGYRGRDIAQVIERALDVLLPVKKGEFAATTSSNAGTQQDRSRLHAGISDAPAAGLTPCSLVPSVQALVLRFRGRHAPGALLAVIRLEGLPLFGHHGANAAERTTGTRLDVMVELELDTTQAEHTDRLRYTVNYDEIFALVRDRVENDSFHLLESLAGDLAHACLSHFGAERVRVRLTKLNLGWPGGGRAIIEVERRQGESEAPGRQGSPRKRGKTPKSIRGRVRTGRTRRTSSPRRATTKGGRGRR